MMGGNPKQEIGGKTLRRLETSGDLTPLNFWYFGLKFFVDRVKPKQIKDTFYTLQLLPYQIKPLSDNIVQCHTPSGLMLVHHQKKLGWRPELDPHRYHRFREASKGDVIFDVGAYVGSLTIRDAKKVGDNGLVVSVEPMPNHRILRANIHLNDLRNVIPLNSALADYDGTAQLNVTENPEGNFLASSRTHREIWQTITVPVKKLDSIVQELEISRVNFIKIDAEGAELAILRGAQKTLQEDNIHLAIACYHTSQEVHEVSSYLIQNGFRVLVSEDSIVYAHKT